MTKENDKRRDALLDAVKVAARFSPATIAVASVTVLFGPRTFVAKLGLDAMVGAHRPLIGFACLLSLAILLVAQMIPLGIAYLHRRWKQGREHRDGIKRLQALTRSEKNLLNQYLSRETRTLMLDTTSGATAALQHDGVIRRTGDQGDMVAGFAFNIQPWAWNYLRNNRLLLETTEGSNSKITDLRTRRRG